MADISAELAAILAAIYGEDVRGSIHDAIDKINKVSEVVISAGTAVSSTTSSSTGFYEDSLYINTSTCDLWKCTGTNAWTLVGNLKVWELQVSPRQEHPACRIHTPSPTQTGALRTRLL